jgi:hypothetical protein
LDLDSTADVLWTYGEEGLESNPYEVMMWAWKGDTLLHLRFPFPFDALRSKAFF